MNEAQAVPPTPLLDPLPKILCLGSLNLIAGASGIGKTALLAWIMKQFRDGAPIFGHATHPPSAIGYLTADRPWQDTKHWFEAVGFPDVRHYSIVDDPTLKLPNQRLKHLRFDFFKTCVRKLELPPNALLVVDPIALYLGGNLLDYDTVAFGCIEIHRWLQETIQNYATVGVCHASKQRADKNDRYLRLQDRISGSGALLGYTGTQMYLAAPEETGDKEGRYTFLWNPHRAKAEVFQFQKGPDGLFLTDHATHVQSAEDELEEMEAAYVTGTELAPLDQLILTHIPYDRSIPTHTFLLTLLQTPEGAAVSRATIFRALKRLVRWGLITRTEHGLYQRVDLTLRAGGESPTE